MKEIPNIKGFIETSFVDWPAKVSSVVFLSGCNFRCPYCHNHSLVLDPSGLQDLSWDWILLRLHGLRGWVDGICLSGGEPTLHDSLERIVRDVRSMGFLVKLDTNGSRPEVLKALLAREMLDAVSMDIKGPLRPEPYARCAGRTVQLHRILQSIQLLKHADLDVEFRTTVVPGLLDDSDILEIARFLPMEIPYHLQGFRPQDVLDPRLRSVPPFPEDVLDHLRSQVSGIRGEIRPSRRSILEVLKSPLDPSLQMGTSGTAAGQTKARGQGRRNSTQIIPAGG